MTDAERVLRVLLHDLRTPLGVAQGYLRMMQEGRLTAAAETERAVTKALSALGQTARLCQDASDFIDLDTGGDRVRTADVPASELVAEFSRLAEHKSAAIASSAVTDGAQVSLAGDAGEVAEAVFVVVRSVGSGRTLRVESTPGELRFLAAGTEPAGGVEPFDLWSHGLAVAAAGRRIAWSSGLIQKLANGNGLIVTFPLRHGTGAPTTA
ncbi:MAG TPA: histidine kinase dimerization/phospho-acceptor domain-containing protein [Vicinamibacterales bacterium]|nr:histidine kinase dimerization/phospho-acceptor domain-containing protein [Vicinamibacterales bacterium]